MTDEEKRIFEKWFEEKKENCEVYGNGDDFWVDDEIKKFCLMGYELGLKAGRPQWHDLRKDPNDLPDEGTYLVVWRNDYGYKEIFIMNYEEDDEEELHWVDGDYEVQDDYIIAWCEIPTFDKE